MPISVGSVIFLLLLSQETHAAHALGAVQGGAPEFDTFPSSLSLPSGFVTCGR